jgi:2-polyprenyl-3-methyl-5-hydroxy-6-metoxy-1,4-benzoquinol methylase
LGFWALKSLAKSPVKETLGCQFLREGDTAGTAKLERYFGQDIWTRLTDKVVLDFGCGKGKEAIVAALNGAQRVYGIDIRDVSLEIAQRSSKEHGVQEKCAFLKRGLAKTHRFARFPRKWIAYSLDSFEHFSEPKQILDQIYCPLAPGGEAHNTPSKRAEGKGIAVTLATQSGCKAGPMSKVVTLTPFLRK